MAVEQKPSSGFEVKPWRSAGLILTYYCGCECASCYLNCHSQREKAFMPVREALDYWRSIEAMGGPDARIHLTGGEPFSNWSALLEIMQAACAEGLIAHEVETNASWCTDSQLAKRRCGELAKLSLGRLVISCDVYHQQFVPFERIRLLVETVQDVLGPERVRVRWRDFFAEPVDISGLSEEDCRSFFREAWYQHRERLTGRAARMIAPLLEAHPAETFAQENCYKPLLVSRGVHIDPAGNVLPGVCSGLILGNARDKPLGQIWSDLAHTEDEILLSLAECGPYGLLGLAENLGYKPHQQGYANKCHLCTEVRSFLSRSGKFEPTIGPAQCYNEN